MQAMNIGVFGASGYSGLELLGLISRHPKLSLRFAAGDRFKNEPISSQVRGVAGTFLETAAAEAKLAEADVVLLATPAEVSLELGKKALAAKVKVVDLSGAFRLKSPALYPPAYGFAHPAPELLARAVYGLPELGRPSLDGGLVANPGCYATAAALAGAPLLRSKLVDPKVMVFTGASGVSGAGRKATEAYSFCELDDDFRAYKTLGHQHAPEIAQTIGAPDVAFVPHLLPITRGLMVTLVAPLNGTEAQVRAAFADAYTNEPLVELAKDADDVRLSHVVRTPLCRLGVTVANGRVAVTAALDNLLKGAASQAMQNVNRLAGFAETLGLVS